MFYVLCLRLVKLLSLSCSTLQTHYFAIYIDVDTYPLPLPAPEMANLPPEMIVGVALVLLAFGAVQSCHLNLCMCTGAYTPFHRHVLGYARCAHVSCMHAFTARLQMA